MTEYDHSAPRDDAQGEPGWSRETDSTDVPIAARAQFPWPPTGDEPVLDAWGRTWSGASLHPGQFFASMPRQGSIGPAVLYYLSIGIPVAGAQLFWTMVRSSTGNAVDATAGALGGIGDWSPLMGFLFSPVYLLVSLFLAAGVTHLLLKLFNGASGDYGMTTRVFAFAYSPQLLGIIPVAGTFAGFIWMVVVAIWGLREAHRTTTARAAAAILIPLAFALVFVALAVLIASTGRLLDVAI